MKTWIAMAAFLLWACSVSGAAETVRPAIREFDTATLSRLGREIYQHDQLAWIATDVLLANVKKETLAKEKAGGWLVDISNPLKPLVRFLRSGKNGMEAAYDITFQGGKPKFSVPKDRALTPEQKANSKAKETASTAMTTGSRPWCGGNPNTVVLNDPDGTGYLVYFLRAKPTANAIPVGGHYRITVSADGAKAEQVDQLFVSCLTMDHKGGPNGEKSVGLAMGHLVSNTPVETHVFVSLQEKLPFYVTTPDGRMWKIENGEIAQINPENPKTFSDNKN